MPDRQPGTGEGEWGDSGRAAVKGFFDSFVTDRTGTLKGFIPWMFTETLSAEEANGMLAETMPPTLVASQLLYDGWMGDWTATLDKVDVPLLFFVREENGAAARPYLEQHAPGATTVVLGGHGMFWDHAEPFNRALDEFLAGLGS